MLLTQLLSGYFTLSSITCYTHQLTIVTGLFALTKRASHFSCHMTNAWSYLRTVLSSSCSLFTSLPLSLSLSVSVFLPLSVCQQQPALVAVGKMSTIYVLASCLLATDKGINVGSCVRVQRGVWVPVCWTPIRGHQPELLLSLPLSVYMTGYNVCYVPRPRPQQTSCTRRSSSYLCPSLSASAPFIISIF